MKVSEIIRERVVIPVEAWGRCDNSLSLCWGQTRARREKIR